MRAAELRGQEWIDSRYKRSLDIMVAIGSLPASIPLAVGALGLSRAIDGEGAIFRHQRFGQHGRQFTVAKVRTLKDIEPDVTNRGVSDEHATALGRALRLRGLDEIPQVINVLAGQMSLVGPRAMPPSGIAEMEASLSRNDFDEWLEVYNLSKPGGVSSYGLSYRLIDQGLRTYQNRAPMDMADYKNASLAHDLMLIRKAASTGLKLFFSRGFAPELPQEEEQVSISMLQPEFQRPE